MAGTLYRRSRHLVCSWEKDGLVVRNYRYGVAVAVDPRLALLLHGLDRWHPPEAIGGILPWVRPSELRRFLSDLVKLSLLERAAGPIPKREDPLKEWEEWSPLAAAFHFGTRNVPIRIDNEASERALRKKARRIPQPGSVKRYPWAPSFVLPVAKRDGEFPDVLLRRRTWRRFGDGRLSLEALATLCDLTFGVQKWADTRYFRPVPLKTSPSGGACHPLEAYVLALEVEDLPRGLYHYVADGHRLELLRKGAKPKDVTKYIPGQPEYEKAAALFLVTAVFARSQWRYSYPRAYRSVLLEAGHFGQTFCLVATWLGLAPFCTALLDDARIERDIDVDGISEGPLYALGVGIRPPGVDWAP